MDIVLTGVLGEGALVYLDDIMVYSEDIKLHYNKLDQVLARLRRANLKLKLEKCQFFRKSLVYLGYLVTNEWLKPDHDKVMTLEKYSVPTSVEQARSFIGLVGYYRQMVPEFSRLASPITSLFKKNATFNWTPECQRAFQEIIRKIISYPVIHFPDFTKPFIISTDASGYGLGAVLSQQYDQWNIQSRLFPGYSLRQNGTTLLLKERPWALSGRCPNFAIWYMGTNLRYGWTINH